MEVTVIDLLKQLAVAIPSIMVGTQAITAAINGALKVESDKWQHAISWIVAVLGALGFVAFNGLDFGLSTVWNYVVGGIAGVIIGACSNGFYDWESIKAIFDLITELFKTKTIVK